MTLIFYCGYYKVFIAGLFQKELCCMKGGREMRLGKAVPS